MNPQDQIIRVTKIKEGQTPLYPETFFLDDLINEMCQYAKAELKKIDRTNVDVEVFKYSRFEKCLLHADRVKLRQVFINLLDNSVKYTDRGCIFFGFHTSVSNNINFFVEDTGLGICNENDLELSIAQGLVQQLGGSMEVRPSEDAGTAVNFNIACTPCELSNN